MRQGKQWGERRREWGDEDKDKVGRRKKRRRRRRRV